MKEFSKKTKVLFFATASFPYGKGETFIENEIRFLAGSYEKVLIVTDNSESGQTRKIPSNCKVIKVPYLIQGFRKILTVTSILDFLFWEELLFIKSKKTIKITFGVVKTMLVSLYNAKRLAKYYSQVCNENIVGNESIDFYSYWCNDSALAFSYIKVQRKLNLFCRIHGWDVFFEVSKYNYLPYRGYITKNMDAIFSISNYGIEYCKKNIYFDKSKLKLSRLGVFNPYEPIFFINKESTIISCSNLIALKRVGLIIDSLSLVNSININWIHIGDGIERETLENLAFNKLKNNIKYSFVGILSNKEVYQFYLEMKPDLFINLSSSEGIPVSIMEAMSFGVPVIGTNVGGVSEIVEDEANGFLLSPNPTPVEVAKKIERYFTLKEDEKKKLRVGAYSTWKEKYNAEVNYPKFLGEIASL